MSGGTVFEQTRCNALAHEAGLPTLITLTNTLTRDIIPGGFHRIDLVLNVRNVFFEFEKFSFPHEPDPAHVAEGEQKFVVSMI